MSDSPQIQRLSGWSAPRDRDLGRCLAQAFPIEQSDEFSALLRAITEAESRGLQETRRQGDGATTRDARNVIVGFAP